MSADVHAYVPVNISVPRSLVRRWIPLSHEYNYYDATDSTICMDQLNARWL